MRFRNLHWRHLRALHQLFVDGKTTAKITDNGYILNILINQKKLLKFKSGNQKIIEAENKYYAFYEENLKSDFDQYSKFFELAKIDYDGRRGYTEEDIKSLTFVWEYREELNKNLTTIRTFSAEIFKHSGSKYLENKPSLRLAVCRILGIQDFPDADPKNHQWRLVADCINPVAIILCENIANLKSPARFRQEALELWYVGGNNIGIVDFISTDKLQLPIYYSCDWDYHGLSIYSRIKSKLFQKGCDIKLITPSNSETALPVDSPHHYSAWKSGQTLSGLDSNDFSKEAIELITKLISENKWMEEESLDLISLFQSYR